MSDGVALWSAAKACRILRGGSATPKAATALTLFVTITTLKTAIRCLDVDSATNDPRRWHSVQASLTARAALRSRLVNYVDSSCNVYCMGQPTTAQVRKRLEDSCEKRSPTVQALEGLRRSMIALEATTWQDLASRDASAARATDLAARVP